MTVKEGSWGSGYPTVLHVVTGLNIGGIARQLVEFVNRSTAPGNHHFAAVDGRSQALDPAVPNRPILLGALASGSSLPPRFRPLVRALRHAVREIRPTIVHAHQPMNWTLAELGTPLGIPIVTSLRGFGVWQQERARFRIASALAHVRARALICNSEDLASEARARGLHVRPVDVIPNGVDTDRFAVAPFDRGPPTIVAVANLFPYKRLGRLLHATRVVLQELPDARMTFVGDGVERGRLVHLADEIGVTHAVTFAGEVTDPRSFVAAADVVALTSEHEGFPNALLEAMAMGRPVVATRVGGIPELVREGKDGFLTSADPVEIAERLVQIVRDPSLRDRMGVCARARAETFTWDRVVKSTEAVYARVLRGR